MFGRSHTIDPIPLRVGPSNVRFGSLATEPFSARADQCPLLLRKRTFAEWARLSAKCE